MEHFDALNNLLAGYVLGDVTSEEAARVLELLETNPEIALEIHRLQTILTLLPLSLPPTPAPEGLRVRLLKAQNKEINHRPHETPRQRDRILSGKALCVGLIAAFMVVLLWENHRLDRALTATRNQLQQLESDNITRIRQEQSRYQEAIKLLRQPDNRFLALRGIESVSSASGSLVMVPRKDKAILVLQDVRPLPPGKVYRMWAFVNGQKVSCSDFTPDEREEVFLTLPLDRWGRTTKVVVTIEPNRNIPQPVGEMVITGG